MTPGTPLPWHSEAVPPSPRFDEGPWVISDANGETVAEAYDGPNAAYLVHAANTYPELVAHLKEMVRFCRSVRPGGRVLMSDPDIDGAKALLQRIDP